LGKHCIVTAGPAMILPGVQLGTPVMKQLRSPIWASVALAVAAPTSRTRSTKSAEGRMIGSMCTGLSSPYNFVQNTNDSLNRTCPYAPHSCSMNDNMTKWRPEIESAYRALRNDVFCVVIGEKRRKDR
jgi:hypothetical protein